MNEFLWVEKYRPQTIDDVVLPESIKSTFKDFVAKGEISNLLLCGTAGTGKTTVAKALCNELGADFIVINGSDEGRLIDTLRTKIKNFASTVSLGGNSKVVILDEADYMSPESVQPALRGFIEEFSANCRFIFTCNFKNRIIEPLHSRCTVIDFKVPSQDKPAIASAFYKRVCDILESEGIDYSKEVVAELVSKHFPDNRRILNELQRYSSSGVIDSGILTNIAEEKIAQLMTALENRKWGDMRKWVAQNSDNDPVLLYRKIFNSLESKLKAESIPAAVLLIADYQYKNAFVADAEVNLVACLTEIMSECAFK